MGRAALAVSRRLTVVDFAPGLLIVLAAIVVATAIQLAAGMLRDST